MYYKLYTCIMYHGFTTTFEIPIAVDDRSIEMVSFRQEDA